MSNVKKITLTENFLPHVTNIDEVKKETQFVIENLYSKFYNEKNYNNCQKALVALEEYRYVPKYSIIPNGKFVRQLNTSDTNNIQLQDYGFVIECTKYYVKIKIYKNISYIDWKNNVIFVKLTQDDYMRSYLGSLEHNDE